MSKNLRLYLEIAEEAKRLTMEGLEFQEALRQAKEMYKKSCSQPASNENNDNEKILNDILTDKLEIDNHGIYNKDGQTLRGLEDLWVKNKLK